MCKSVRSVVELANSLLDIKDWCGKVDPEMHLTGSVLDGSAIKNHFSIDIFMLCKKITSEHFKDGFIQYGNEYEQLFFLNLNMLPSHLPFQKYSISGFSSTDLESVS